MARQGSAISARALLSGDAALPQGALGPATARTCERAAAAISSFSMLRTAERVLAAFSGGADSTALAVVLGKLGYRVTLAHIDHGMRPDSELDAFHCRSTARRLGIPVEVVCVGVEPPTEAKAREVRYGALGRLAQGLGIDRIATGHTLNDDAETVKMRLARGGFGLGIPPVRGNIIRPLLSIARQDTEAVCREAGLLWLEDPSNTDLRITRNRIRSELARTPGGEIERLAMIGAQNRARKAALEAALERLSGCLETGERPRLDRKAVFAAPPDVARGLLRQLLRAAGIEPSGRLVEDIFKKVVPFAGSSLDLPGGLAVLSEPHGGCLVVGRRTEASGTALPEVDLEKPGFTAVAEWGLGVSVLIDPAPPPANRRMYMEVFDAGALKGDLRLRQWRPGDFFYPLRREEAPVRKKLQDLFVDNKVPRAERHRVPVITSGGQIVWVVGQRIDDRFKVTPQTRRTATICVVTSPGERR